MNHSRLVVVVTNSCIFEYQIFLYLTFSTNEYNLNIGVVFLLFQIFQIRQSPYKAHLFRFFSKYVRYNRAANSSRYPVRLKSV